MLHVEQLESRLTPTLVLVGTTLVAVGGDAPDSLVLWEQNGIVHATLDGGGNHEEVAIPAGAVTHVFADLGDGGDLYLNLAHNQRLTEVVQGGDGNDFLYAGHGAATLQGGAGEDWLFSGTLPDNADAGIDNAPQVLDGGAGVDIIFCSLGDDGVVFDSADMLFSFGAKGNDSFLIP